jgi:chitodextrinase
MKIEKIAVAAMTVLCAVSLVTSCKKVKEQEKPVKVVETNFTVGLNSVQAEYAEVVVRHTGAADVTWFGFVTEDVTGPEQDLISAQLAQLDKKALHVGKSQTVAISNLKEYVTYRYIAFPVNEAGETFGKSGSITFSTSPKFDVAFAAEATDVQCHEATFSVSHEGNAVLTYACFVTDDLKTEVSELAAADFAKKVTDGKLNEGVELLSGNSKSVTVDNLKDEASFRFIVYGIYDHEGTVLYYGTPAECAFSTLLDYTTVAFDAAVSNVKKSSADVAVTYSAAKEDLTWYGFITDDISTDAASLIAAKVAGISAEDFKTGEQSVSVSGLTPDTDYRYIVTGIDASGVYGVPAQVKFTTMSEAYDNTVFSVSASDITFKSAKLTITHTGLDDFEYAGFLTEDLTSAVSEIALPANVDANLLKGKENTVTVENLQPGISYRYVVVGRYAGNEYGTRGDVVFTTKDDAVAASYEDFLGTWTIKEGTSYDLVVEKKVQGQSYTIKNLNNATVAKWGIDTPLIVEGRFNNGKLTIACQKISELYQDPEDEAYYTDMFCGVYEYEGSNVVDDTEGRIITTFVMKEDGSVQLRPGTSSDGDTYVMMRFFQVNDEDVYSQDSFGTPLPNTATPPAPASEAYNKWLGDWTIGGFAMHIEKATVNATYKMTGFYNDFYAIVDFDSATGNIVFNHMQQDYTVNSQAGDTYQMFTTGINSLNYVAVRSGDDTSLAIFSLNSAGTSGTVTGVTYEHATEGQTTVTEIGLYGYNAAASKWTKWNGWNYFTLPCNIAKGSSTSSVPTAFNTVPGVDVQRISRTKEANVFFSRIQK